MSTKNFYIISAVAGVLTLLISMVFYLVIQIIVDKVKEPFKPESEQVIEEAIGQNLVIREVRDQTNKWMYRISKVEFEGHTYIVLEDNGSCLLHDPDCKCQNPK